MLRNGKQILDFTQGKMRSCRLYSDYNIKIKINPPPPFYLKKKIIIII